MSHNRPSKHQKTPGENSLEKHRTLEEIVKGVKDGTIKPNKIKLAPLPKGAGIPASPPAKPSPFDVQARIEKAKRENPAPAINSPAQIRRQHLARMERMRVNREIRLQQTSQANALIKPNTNTPQPSVNPTPSPPKTVAPERRWLGERTKIEETNKDHSPDNKKPSLKK